LENYKTITHKLYTIMKLLIYSSLLLLLASCGGASKKDDQAKLNDLKAKLEGVKEKREALNKEITEIESQISKLDTNKKAKTKLVALETIGGGNFQHSIDLQGRVEADNIVNVSPKYGPALVTAVHINEGSYVKPGSLLLTLNTTPYRKQREVLTTQLTTAEDLLQRQENLWKQNIGSEVQVISARTNVETLKKNIASIDEQIAGGRVYAPISGVVDVLNVKVGETFGASFMPQLTIVNKGSLKVITEVPENYLGKIGAGSKVLINFPDINSNVNGVVSRTGASINPNSRTYTVEVNVSGNSQLKPNQLAVVKIVDYQSTNAVTIPVNVVQTDLDGKYVLIAEKNSNNVYRAVKRKISLGNMYGERIEIKAGLAGGEQIIVAGYQNLYEGQLLSF
jgi:membrane fusion protein, multidrug efflux system